MDIFNRINVFNNYKDVSNDEKQDLENPARKDNEDNEDNENNDDNQVIDVIELSANSSSNSTADSNNNNSNSNSDSNSDSRSDTNPKDIIDVNNDETGGIIYDILHIFDDIYVYGRTLIENNYFNLSENDEFNLVYPNIYIGNYSTSTNLQLLKDLGITHIVSVIPSFNPPFLDKFNYLHIQAYDDESQDIKQYFEMSNEFIKKCLNEGGKVLIHCMVGRSRSVSICMAFLIYIIQGNFHKRSLNLQETHDLYDDIYNSIEYNKFIKINNTKKNSSYDTHTNYEKINTSDHIKPNLNNKEKFYIVYKKEIMLNEMDDLIHTYNVLKKEITVFKKKEDCDEDNTYKTINELNKIIKNMKNQSGKHFIIQLLKYMKKYRSCAEPNPYFINQLSESIF